MAEQNIATLFAVINVIFSGALAVMSFTDWYRCRHETWSWIKLTYVAIGLYWCVLYGWVLAPKDTYDSIWFGRTFVRPAYTFTIGAMLAGSIIGVRRRRK